MCDSPNAVMLGHHQGRIHMLSLGIRLQIQLLPVTRTCLFVVRIMQFANTPARFGIRLTQIRLLKSNSNDFKQAAEMKLIFKLDTLRPSGLNINFNFLRQTVFLARITCIPAQKLWFSYVAARLCLLCCISCFRFPCVARSFQHTEEVLSPKRLEWVFIISMTLNSFFCNIYYKLTWPTKEQEFPSKRHQCFRSS